MNGNRRSSRSPSRGTNATTLTPKFGPDGYMHCLPFTGIPVADLWQINTWMAERQRQQFQKINFAKLVEPAGFKSAVNHV